MQRWIVIYVFLMFACVRAGGEEPLELGSRLELFADSYLIGSLDGANLVMHPPRPGETVLEFDSPWEGRHCAYVTILRDGDLYRLYYRGMRQAMADGSDIEVTCVAESKDGIVFTKPKLGLFEVMGSKENNVILADLPPFSHNFSPFIDTRPGVTSDERYKALAGIRSSGLVAFVSADGIRWRKMSESPVLTDGAFDSQNVAFWSESERQYVAYFRIFNDGVRAIARSTSPDFLQWTPRVDMTFGDTPAEHLYTNQTRPYFRAPHIYIAVAARFMPGRGIVSDEQMKALGGYENYTGDCSDAVLMTTRGGSGYDRTFMEAFIRPGPGLSNWTSRTNYPANGIVQTGPEEMSMYVQRNYGQDSHHLQRMVMRLDGIASLGAGYGGGRATTRPLKFSGDRLVLNCSTSAAGGIRVEILDAAGNVLPGFGESECDEIVGDMIERTVTWKGRTGVSELAGKEVRLRFSLKDADIFSVRFME